MICFFSSRNVHFGLIRFPGIFLALYHCHPFGIYRFFINAPL